MMYHKQMKVGDSNVKDFFNARYNWTYRWFSICLNASFISQVITFSVKNDNVPELTEYFDVTLVRVVSSDGLVGSTNTSGASIDPEHAVANISVQENDFPYGLLQFSTGPAPAPNDPTIPAATTSPQVSL